MVEILTIGWILGILFSLLAILGLVNYIKNIIRLKEDYMLKEVLIYLLITSIIAWISTTIVIIFGLMRYEPSNKLWIFFPIMYLIIKASWLTGTYKLIQVVRGAKEEENG